MKPCNRLGLLGAAVAIAVFAVGTARAAADLSPNEKLFAELYKLPAAERTQKIIEGAKKEGGFQFLTGIRGKDGQALLTYWVKRYPDIKIDRSELGAQDAAARVYAEETAGRHLTDVATMSVADTALLLEKNFTARFETPATDKVLPQYKQLLDPDHRFVPWLWSEHGMSYNPNMLSEAEAPKEWFDMCNPKYKGQMSLDPLENRFLTGMLAMMGEEKLREWLECLGKNDPIIIRGHTTRLHLMMAGDHPIMAENYYYQGVHDNELNPKKAPFKPVYSAPTLGYANIELINRMAPHPYGSLLYIDWSLDTDAQSYMASIYRAPVTVKHPFLPDNIPLVLFGPESPAMSEKLAGYWVKSIGDKR
jgi:iron(III) transport system substrate-binding protein